MEMKKNVILEKQNKKLSRLRTDRNKSGLSVNNQTTESSETTKTNPARGGSNKRKKPKRKNRKPTPITQNKQPESSTNSTSAMKNNENNKRQTDNRRRNIADQDSPVIDVTKQTEKESKEGNAHPKNYQSLGSNQKKSYAEAIKTGNQRANLQTAISNLISCLQSFQEAESLSESKAEKNGEKQKGRRPHYRGGRKQ